MKIVYNDGLKIIAAENGKTTEYGCDFHAKYIEAAKKAEKSAEWKTQGDGARFMGTRKNVDVEKADVSYYNSLNFFGSSDKILFSVTVNGLSGVLTKDLTAEKDSEGHIIHSRERIFNGAEPSVDGRSFVTCIKEDYVNAHLAVYNLDTDDYMLVTDGDSCDADAVYSVKDPNRIYFSSKGAGRDDHGEFVKYSPSSILSYDTENGDVQEIMTDGKMSFVKPKDDKDGNLYYIIKPYGEKKRGFWGTILDIILLPWRLLKAIYNFFEFFTIAFTGKGFTEKSDNPAKSRDKSQKELFIEDNLVNADQEYKKNLRHKDNYAGIAPWDWKLVKRTPEGTVTTIKNGVIDYCVLPDGGVVYTNGKHVIKLSADGKSEKIADTALCTKVALYVD